MTKLDVLIQAMKAVRPTATTDEVLRFIAEAMPELRIDLWNGSIDDKVARAILQDAEGAPVLDLQEVVRRLG